MRNYLSWIQCFGEVGSSPPPASLQPHDTSLHFLGFHLLFSHFLKYALLQSFENEWMALWVGEFGFSCPHGGCFPKSVPTADIFLPGVLGKALEYCYINITLYQYMFPDFFLSKSLDVCRMAYLLKGGAWGLTLYIKKENWEFREPSTHIVIMLQ